MTIVSQSHTSDRVSLNGVERTAHAHVKFYITKLLNFAGEDDFRQGRRQGDEIPESDLQLGRNSFKGGVTTKMKAEMVCEAIRQVRHAQEYA